MTVDGTKFFVYNWNNAAALGDCSHCFHPAATDSGAREYVVRNLQFNDVAKKIRYQVPYSGIFHDMTGELTGKGPNSWATAYRKHHEAWAECETDRDVFDGHVCDQRVQIRRIAFNKYDTYQFDGQGLFIIPWDEPE